MNKSAAILCLFKSPLIKPLELTLQKHQEKVFSLEEGVKTTDALDLDAEEESSEAEVEEPVDDPVKRSLIQYSPSTTSVKGKRRFRGSRGYSGVHATVITAKKNFLNQWEVVN